MTALRTALCRHSEYYSKKLREIASQYGKGGPDISKALTAFRLEWAQVRKGQSYAAEQIEKEEWASAFCLEYALAGATIISLRLSPRERIEWLEAGLRAAKLTKDKKDEAEMWGQLGMANDALGEYQLSVSFYKECLKIARLLKDKEREGRTLGSLGLVYMLLRDKTEAKFSFDKALEIARAIGDRMAEGRHLGCLGMMSQGQESIQYFNQALEIARAIGDRQGEVSHLGSLGMAWVDKAEQAKNLPGEALVHPNIIMRNTMPDGSLPRYLQEQIEGQDTARCLQKAATYFEQAVSIAREVGDYPAECRELGNLGTVLSRQGKIERALSRYQRALQIAGELGDRQREVEQLENMRSAYLSLANESEAHRIEAELALISQNGGQPDTKSILDRFGSKEVDPFYEEYWKMSSEEDNKRYWSDYYQANIGG